MLTSASRWDYASEKKLSLLTVIQKKERKVAALMQGHTLPFNALVIVRQKPLCTRETKPLCFAV